MKHVFLYFLIICIAISCKKDHPVDDNVNYTYTPGMKIQQVVNDSTIVITWPKYRGKNFIRYYIQRSALYIKNGKMDLYYDGVDSSTNANDTTFTETKMPVGYQINYSLYIENGGLITDNVAYERPPSTLFYGEVKDALFDKENKRVYIMHLHPTYLLGVTAIDYTTGRQIKSTDFQEFEIGHGDLGDFNGNKELYLAGIGNILILDASSLEVKDRINCGGSIVNSVVNVNGNLYVSTNDTTGGSSECIKVYNRATKNLIGRTGYRDKLQLLFLKGTSTEIVGVKVNDDTTNRLSYYQFSAAGLPLLKTQDTVRRDYLHANPEGLRSFPDGKKFITSYKGAIFSKQLVLEQYLKPDGTYSDYAFNDDGSVIYAADIYKRRIDVINYPAGNVVKSYPTNMYPYKIFRDGNTLICLSITWPTSNAFRYSLVERINL
jgi:hypothetical protein